MFWSHALYSGTYFHTSVAINFLFQASLRKLGEFVLVPQFRLLGKEKSYIEQYVPLLSNRIGKAAEFWGFCWWEYFVCVGFSTFCTFF